MQGLVLRPDVPTLILLSTELIVKPDYTSTKKDKFILVEAKVPALGLTNIHLRDQSQSTLGYTLHSHAHLNILHASSRHAMHHCITAMCNSQPHLASQGYIV